MTENQSKHSPAETSALAVIPSLLEPSSLRNMIENAKRRGSKSVEEAAFRRLVEILPSENDSKLSKDFWRAINTLEESLTQERGKTTRLARTRQKLKRAGIHDTLRDRTVSSKPSEGFHLLLERGLADLSAEAVVLRNRSEFERETIEAAKHRLQQFGVSLPNENVETITGNLDHG